MGTRLARGASVPAGPVDIDLALVLAIDGSGSVDDERFALQAEGYFAAIHSPEFVGAVQAGRHGKIAVSVVEWSGARRQQRSVDWMLIAGELDALALASAMVAMMEAPRLQPDWTSISGAIDFCAGLFALCRYRAARRVIDISGDGANNDGRSVTAARDDAVAAGITINGLPILEVEPELDAYYRDNVIGGRDAFMIAARDLASFGDAIRRKLVTEVAGTGGRFGQTA